MKYNSNNIADFKKGTNNQFAPASLLFSCNGNENALGCFPKYQYYLQDYLGNNRDVLCTDNNGNWTVVQRNEYTPFGVSFPQTVGDAAAQPYKFGGKELDRMHGLDFYDFHARVYSPNDDGFLTIDPLCERYPWISPYAYCSNNPVNRIDPDGRADRRLGPNEIPGAEHRGSEVGKTTSVSVKTTKTTSRIVAKKNEHYGEVEKSPSSVSLDISGEMRGNSKTLADVQVDIKADLGDIITTVDSYDAVAGGFGNGAPENGDYTVDHFRDRSPSSGDYVAGMNNYGEGFSFDLNPQFSTDRKRLRVHPDGGKEGTQGCIGLSGNGPQLGQFKNILRNALKTQSKILTKINILNNPNNNGRNTKKTVRNNGE